MGQCGDARGTATTGSTATDKPRFSSGSHRPEPQPQAGVPPCNQGSCQGCPPGSRSGRRGPVRMQPPGPLPVAVAAPVLASWSSPHPIASARMYESHKSWPPSHPHPATGTITAGMSRTRTWWPHGPQEPPPYPRTDAPATRLLASPCLFGKAPPPTEPPGSPSASTSPLSTRGTYMITTQGAGGHGGLMEQWGEAPSHAHSNGARSTQEPFGKLLQPPDNVGSLQRPLPWDPPDPQPLPCVLGSNHPLSLLTHSLHLGVTPTWNTLPPPNPPATLLLTVDGGHP